MRATARRSARWLSIAVGGPGRRAPGLGREVVEERGDDVEQERLPGGVCARAGATGVGHSCASRGGGGGGRRPPPRGPAPRPPPRAGRRRRRTRAERPDSTCVAARGAPRSAAPRAPPTTPPPATRARCRPTFRDVICRTCRIEGRGALQSCRKRSPMSLIEVALTTICCGCQRGWHLHDVLHECGSVVGFGTSVVAPGTRPGGRSGARRRHDGVGTR